MLFRSRNVEVIFVDDGSTDGTARVFAHYADQLRKYLAGDVLYLAQANKGQCAAVNVAHHRARGDIFVPCDSDDFMLPNRISDHVQCFQDNPQADLVFGDVYICESPRQDPIRSRLEEFKLVPQGAEVYHQLLMRGMFIPSCSYAFRPSVLSYLPGGQLDEEDPGQNLDLLLRAAFHGKVVHHPTHVAKLITREGSASRGTLASRYRIGVGSRRIVDRVIAEYGCRPDVLRAIERRYTPREIIHYMLAGDGRAVRRCVARAFRAGFYSRGLLAAWLASWTHGARERYVARRIPRGESNE